MVRRVFEAVYCKVLVPENELVRPDPANLTPRTRALFDALFPQPRRADQPMNWASSRLCGCRVAAGYRTDHATRAHCRGPRPSTVVSGHQGRRLQWLPA